MDPHPDVRVLFAPSHASWANPVEVQFWVLTRRVISGGHFTSAEDQELQTPTTRRTVVGHLRRTVRSPAAVGTGGPWCTATIPTPEVHVRDWPGPITAITLLVEDLDAARRFYQDVFGLPVTFQDEDSTVFTFGATMINLLRTTAGRDLLHPAAVAPREAGSRLQLTLEVEDVDAACAELAARGVVLLNGPVDRPWGLRTASFQDPGGHVWEVAAPVKG